MYNQPNVTLVDLSESPIERITKTGIQTTDEHYDLDVIIYATGFNAITGAFDQIDIRGAGGQSLADKWSQGPSTYIGLLTAGFPNMVMVAGPQSASGSTNFPRAIERGVEWTTQFMLHARAHGLTRIEAQEEAEAEWGEQVVRAYNKLLARRSKGWFTGYNSNVEGHEEGVVRYQAYFGGGPKYGSILDKVAADGYPKIRQS